MTPSRCCSNIAGISAASCAGSATLYPPMPHGYFDQETVAALTGLRRASLVVDRREGTARIEFPTAMAAGKASRTPGVSTAEGLYRNWLTYISPERRCNSGCAG